MRDESDHVRDIHHGHGGFSTEYNLPIHIYSPVSRPTHDLRRNSDSEEEESHIQNLATDDTSGRSATVFPEERFAQEVPKK